jgi:hypothetical protein
MWRLQRLDVAVAETAAATGKVVKHAVEADEMDKEDFCRKLRRIMACAWKWIFTRAKEDAPATVGEEGDATEDEDGKDDEDDPQITLDELLDGLVCIKARKLTWLIRKSSIHL